MSGDGSYAPRSPDLSSFYSTGPTQPPPPPQTSHQSPVQQFYQRPGSSQFSPPGSLLQPPSEATPTTYFPPTSGSSPQTRNQQALPTSHHSLSGGYSSVAPQYFSPGVQQQPPYGAPSQFQQQPPPPSVLYQSYIDAQAAYSQPPQPQAFDQQYQQQYQQPPLPPSLAPQQFYTPPVVKEESDLKFDVMPPRKATASGSNAGAGRPQIEPSPVKTKFPTARIKRIMQADEEVGKVAQQTPIAVGKALEMFMVALVTKSADVAREKSSKRVSAQMLKQVVESDDQWDFLRDIVSRVDNDEPKQKGGRAAKAESDSEEEGPEKKKPRAGRKKKAAAA